MIPRHRIWAMMKSGAAAAVTTYLLNFNWDSAANQGYADAQVLDTAAEGQNADGDAGSLTVVEVGASVMEVVSNAVDMTGTTDWNKTGMYDPDGKTRALGMGLFATISNLDTSRAFQWASWQTGANITILGHAHKIGGRNVDDAIHVGLSGAGGPIVGTYAGSTTYTVVMILGGSDSNGTPFYTGQTKADYKYGCWFLIKGGVYTDWTLLFIHSTDNTATLYPATSVHGNTTVTIDDFKVPDTTSTGGDLSGVMEKITNFSSFTAANGTSLNTASLPEVGGNWTEESGDWDIQSNRANPDGAAIASIDSSEADMIIKCIVNGGTADQPAILIRFTDTSNYWYLQADRANNQVELHEVNATVDNVRASAAVTVNDSTDYDLTAIFDAQTITGYLDGANRITYASAALNETATEHGLRAENTAGRFDNFYALPRTHADYGAILDAV